MTIQRIQTETIVITGAPALDPITVVFRDAGPSRGGIIVECYGKAWAAFWAGMGSKTVREFVAACDAEYLATKLWRENEKRTKATETYLLRITTAIRSALSPNEKLTA